MSDDGYEDGSESESEYQASELTTASNQVVQFISCPSIGSAIHFHQFDRSHPTLQAFIRSEFLESTFGKRGCGDTVSVQASLDFLEKEICAAVCNPPAPWDSKNMLPLAEYLAENPSVVLSTEEQAMMDLLCLPDVLNLGQNWHELRDPIQERLTKAIPSVTRVFGAQQISFGLVCRFVALYAMLPLHVDDAQFDTMLSVLYGRLWDEQIYLQFRTLPSPTPQQPESNARLEFETGAKEWKKAYVTGGFSRLFPKISPVESFLVVASYCVAWLENGNSYVDSLNRLAELSKFRANAPKLDDTSRYEAWRQVVKCSSSPCFFLNSILLWSCEEFVSYANTHDQPSASIRVDGSLATPPSNVFALLCELAKMDSLQEEMITANSAAEILSAVMAQRSVLCAKWSNEGAYIPYRDAVTHLNIQSAAAWALQIACKMPSVEYVDKVAAVFDRDGVRKNFGLKNSTNAWSCLLVAIDFHRMVIDLEKPSSAQEDAEESDSSDTSSLA